MNPKARMKPSASARQQTLLLVDDDSAVRSMVGRVLADEGYLVLSAANGAEALGIAEVTRLDLVLLDLNMPVQGGWDTFEQLTSKYPLLPVIIITARANQLFTALGAGVGALLEKPLDFPELIETVRALLAEPAETRLARLTGRSTEFHYLPSTDKSR